MGKKFLTFKPNRRKTREQELDTVVRSVLTYGFAPMLCAAIASFITSFNGVVTITDWLAGISGNIKYIALIVSFVSAGISLSLWGMTIRFLRAYVTGQATSIGIFVLIYLIVMTAVASTSTSFIGLTEQSARALHLMDEAARYAKQTRELGARSLEMQNMVTFIRPEADAACIKSDTELKGGLISGSAGKGPIASTLQTLCVRKTNLANALDDTLSQARPLIGNARDRSRQMDMLILDRTQSLSDRELSFYRNARTLEASLDELQATDRMRAVRSSYQAIGLAIEGLESLKASVSPGQANALSEIIASEKASAEAMRMMLDQIEAVPLPQGVRAELVPAPELTLRYVIAHLPQLGLAISLDAFGPLTALLLFAGSLRRKRKSQQPKSD